MFKKQMTNNFQYSNFNTQTTVILSEAKNLFRLTRGTTRKAAANAKTTSENVSSLAALLILFPEKIFIAESPFF